MNKLYFIGNGFDKHHRMKCGYDDFKSWLKKYDKRVYSNLKRLYGDLQDDWWSNFEESLSNFDTSIFPNEVAETPYFVLRRKLVERYGDDGLSCIDDYEMKNGTNYNGLLAQIAKFEMSHLNEDLSRNFGAWAKNIELSDESKRDCDLDTNALFFTLNYTKTLEDLYKIKKEQVVHLHGSADNNTFIFGHNKTAKEMREHDWEKHMYDNPTDDKGYDARMAMYEAAEDLKKPVESVFHEYCDEFESLRNIEELEVLGFSYSPIDLPYLERIIKVTGKDIKVRLGWHEEKDKKAAESFAKMMELSDCEIFEF